MNGRPGCHLRFSCVSTTPHPSWHTFKVWEMDSRQPDTAARIMDPFMLEFPKTLGALFSQEAKMGEVVAEDVGFWVEETGGVLAKKYMALCKRWNMEPELKMEEADHRTYRYIGAVHRGKALKITLMSDRKSIRAAGATHVKVELHTQAEPVAPPP